MKIAAITRNPIDSPRMADNDKAILDAVANILRQMGHETKILDEKEYSARDRYDIIYHMSRTPDTLAKLKQAEAEGQIIVNRPSAVQNCSRLNQMQILDKHTIVQPSYFALLTEETPPTSGYPFWFKKSEGWSCHPNDVCYITDIQEAEKALAEFRGRNIKQIICCKHIIGDIVKFYGIKNAFFHWTYPIAETSKFGLEKINGATQHHPFQADELQKTAQKAAAAIGAEIFGGDAIITEKGEIYIIDLNDFPSFSSCRAEAANAIAHLIHSKKSQKA